MQYFDPVSNGQLSYLTLKKFWLQFELVVETMIFQYPYNEKVAKLWENCQREDYRGSNSENWKYLNRKNCDFGHFLAENPLKNQKSTMLTRFLCYFINRTYMTPEKVIETLKNFVLWLELIFKPRETKTCPGAWMLSYT